MNQKTLVIRFSSMGDIILALPVVEAIKQDNPQASVDFLTRKSYASLVDLFPGIDNVHSFDNNMRSLLRELKKQKYHTVIDLQKNPRSILFTAAINPKRVVSYPKRRLKRELLIRRPNLRLNIGHTVDAYLATLLRLKVKKTARQPRVELNAKALDFGRDFIDNTGLAGKIIGLCPGSKHYEKRWGQFQELARLIIDDDDKSVIIFSGPDDDFDPNLNLNSDKLVAAHRLRFDRLAGVMCRCDLIVANDSGLMHLAVALSVPVVAIFGPTHPALGFSPLGPGDIALSDNVPCSPCSLHGEKRCRMPQKYCFENITPQRVKAEVNGVLYAESPGKILRKTR